MNNRLTYLLKVYFDQISTETEETELFEIIGNTENEEIEMMLQGFLEVQEPVVGELRRERILNEILHSVQDNDTSTSLGSKRPSTPLRVVWRRVAAAAAIIIAVAGGSYFLLNKDKKEQIATIEPQEKRFKNDIAAPASSKATITLADGSVVELESVTSGTLAKQGNVNVVKTADGKITYNGTATEMVYNTLTNPRGSKVIDMTLADGSHVWLNAGSSLTYPVAFAGPFRKVSITGEAYFEVTHNAAMPFIVTKGEMEITDLGTSFNVNAYDDEAEMKVTLIEGAVKIYRSPKDDRAVILQPGQQAKVAAEIKVVGNVDMQEVLAWKNGKFNYSNADLESIMRQLARWYDVDVVYKDKISDRYTVAVPRDVPVSQLFKFIEMSGGVHFKIEGKEVTVMK